MHLLHKPVNSRPKVQSKKYCQAKKGQIKEVIAFALLQCTIHAPHALFHSKTSLFQRFFLHKQLVVSQTDIQRCLSWKDLVLDQTAIPKTHQAIGSLGL